VNRLLDMLVHPLIGAVDGNPERGYLLATEVRVTQHRLGLLSAGLAEQPD
jgi:hypothetical protein